MPNNTSVSIPEHITGAAFLVQDHIVTQVNPAAQQRHIPVGASIYELISSGSKEYESFRSGKLYLQLYVTGLQYSACVSCHQKAHLFVILSEYANTELQALALASNTLKDPLQNALVGAEQLSRLLAESTDPSVQKSFSQISHSLYQIMRSVGNMSDASSKVPPNLAYLNVKSLLEEIAEKIQQRIPPVSRSIKFTGLSAPIYTMADAQALERAIYNMVSNAIKFSPENSTISLKAFTKAERLYITVENPCDTESSKIAHYFDRYLREPAIEETRFGIGLGLSVVRNIAASHRGTLLATKKAGNVASFTMSIAIRPNSNVTLYSPSYLRVDHYGGFDPILIELSDVLPDGAYEKI